MGICTKFDDTALIGVSSLTDLVQHTLKNLQRLPLASSTVLTLNRAFAFNSTKARPWLMMTLHGMLCGIQCMPLVVAFNYLK